MTTFDDDVDFETEEETSEFEEEEEVPVNTVTVKLPTAIQKSSVQKTASPSDTQETTNISKSAAQDVKAYTVSDESSSKKSSKSKTSKELNEKVLENGHDSKYSKTEIHAESEQMENQSESKDVLSKEKASSRTKPLELEASDDASSSKRHKEKSEKKKSKEESKKPFSDVGAAEEVIIDGSSKKSSKSKREKLADQDETTSGKKKDKYADEESGSAKSKRDKQEKTAIDELSSLQYVGEAVEIKEKSKSKKKRSSLEGESKYLEMPSTSPSSSSSDLEKPKYDKNFESRTEDCRSDETDEQVKVIKVSKKKSKKSSALQLEASESMEVNVGSPSTCEKLPQVTTEVLSANSDKSLDLLETSNDEVRTTEKELTDNVADTFEEVESKNKLSVDAQRDRDQVSPDNTSFASFSAGRIEQTRNYLKALTPDDGRLNNDDEKSNEKTSEVIEIAKSNEMDSESITLDKDGKEHVWENEAEVQKGKTIENEDSDFTYRRKSMDEFIKKILAEAREENLKLKDDTEKARKPPKASSPNPKPKDTFDDDDQELIEKKSKSRRNLKPSDISPATDDANKEVDEINKYFAKQYEDLDSNLNENKLDPYAKENGYLGKEQAKNELNEDIKIGEFAFKNKKSQLSNYADLEDGDSSANMKQKHYSSTPIKKPVRNALMNGDVSIGKDDDGEETADITDFLAKFKRERQALFGGPYGSGKYEPEIKRSAETEELIKDKTRNMKSVIDQQMDICHNVRAVSKQLDDLEKELREVRQISLDRRGKMEAMENAVNAEYKMYEIEHQAAVDRVKDKKPIQKFTQEVKDQMIASIQQQQASRAKKNDRYLTPDDVSSSLRRRVGSVSSQAALLDEQDNFFMSSSPASSSPYHSFAPSRGRGTSSDRDPYLSSFLTIDRRRDSTGGGSRSRLSFIDNGSDFDDLPLPSAAQSSLFNKPKSRASVATMDTSSSISADDFLAKMRSKYSFLSPSHTGDDISSSSSRMHVNSRSSGYRPLSSTQSGHDSYRSRLEEPSSSYLSVKSIGGRGPSPSSIYDSPGSRYSLASGGSRYSGLSGLSHTSPQTSYEPKSRRAASVSDVRSGVHYDRHLGGYTTGGYSGYGGSTSGGASRYGLGATSRYSDSSNQLYTPSHSSSTPSGGEFKSRFLDKVREKRSSVGSSSSSSSHDLADRVRARLNNSKAASSYDLPAPPSSTKPATVGMENSTIEAK